ncbi:GDP-mannose 4,6-dehydratase [Nocardioides szechwanensis]|uniref:GDP-mannose 4,6-dehydratase n=1 Tax=Nocardioides szechwanensis TaxID=1005944 RepID=A0A1H0BSB7_9ACTN|nr:GDP-mannose 4,6-dehydratase [Nocardioides szechwanensis]GEP33629.1 GDP-mannose 4,6-dehydratase [Nocardioides szechwanensis]SDN48554.1 GDPmannose 4,6-dehydratase [Nocardioides szechwanensis]
MSPAARTALVTGVAGQDGIYLARRLIGLGFRVVGTERQAATAEQDLAVYLDGVDLVQHDLRDDTGFRRLLEECRPDWVFNLAAFSSVGASWDQPDLVDDVNGAAVERMLDVMLDHRARTGDDVRFFQAGSAEEHGSAADSPYAKAKARAHAATTQHREEHGLFACTAVLHNHESPLRPQRFVTRKITRAAAEIALGKRESVSLGNLEVSRDWGAASDYVAAMTRMLELDTAADLVVATGVTHTLRDLVETAFSAAGVTDPWSYVVQDQALVRPADAPTLDADTSETRQVLGWEPTLTFEQVVEHMVAVDLERLRTGVEESTDYLYPH